MATASDNGLAGPPKFRTEVYNSSTSRLTLVYLPCNMTSLFNKHGTLYKGKARIYTLKHQDLFQRRAAKFTATCPNWAIVATAGLDGLDLLFDVWLIHPWRNTTAYGATYVYPDFTQEAS